MDSVKEQFPLPVPTKLSRPFWEAAKTGKLVFQFCHQCQSFQSYPKPCCSECGSDSLEWKGVCGKGRVYSFTIPRYVVGNSSFFQDKLPFIVAIIELDEGIRIYSNIIGVKPEGVTIGMKVQVEFENISPEINLPKFKPVAD